MQRHKHLFEEVVSFENLLAASQGALRATRLACWWRSFRCADPQMRPAHWKPDKYRLIPTRCGVDFVGFVVHSKGRVRVRAATARRFQDRFQAMRWEMRQRQRSAASLTNSVRAWIAHVKHAQSVGLRRAVLSR